MTTPQTSAQTLSQASALPRVRFRYLGNARAVYEIPPGYATPGSVGIDLRACLADEAAVIAPGARLAVPSGLAVEPLPAGQAANTAGNPDSHASGNGLSAGLTLAGFVYSRSGLGAVQGLTVAQGVGVIDPDYRGEITVVLLNTSTEARAIRRGDRIAQLVFQPVARVMFEEAAELGATCRGAGGFGHTGAG